MFFEPFVYRHLDWCSPLEWLGVPDYWVIEKNGSVQAVLACPQEPPQIAWIRLFAYSGLMNMNKAWSLLWGHAREYFSQFGNVCVAAICSQGWFRVLLEQNGFITRQQIILLERRGRFPVQPHVAPEITIRPMMVEDLPGVVHTDKAAFSPLWQHTQSSFEMAFPQAVLATAALHNDRVIGYQISTQTPSGAHLARLAIVPEFQRQGIGRALIADLVDKLRKRAINRLTVNTQSDNLASLALYGQAGFVRTGEQYSVYEFEVHS
ncbi:MAG: GNAT family N-acetyltransferase [Anaerolineales bacterium]|nr:GNAT family N-acetyltransferase [Anaerolineales bacterium]